MPDAVGLWEQRLEEARVGLEPAVTAETCAQRCDADSRGKIVELTNAALHHAFEDGYGSVALGGLDAAADELGVVA